MTLIETMITLGIASGMVLAIMEAVNLTTRSAKSTQASADWTAMIGNITRLISDTNQCTCYMQAHAPTFWANTPLVGVNYITNLGPTIDTYGPSGVGCNPNNVVGSLLISAPSGTNNIIAAPSGINLYSSASNNPIFVYWTTGGASGPSFWLDNLELDIHAKKIVGGVFGSSGLPGGSTDLYSTNRLQNRVQNGIGFQVIRSTAGVVQQCYGVQDQAQFACLNIGGAYNTTNGNPYKCQLEDLQLARGNATGLASAVSDHGQGQKIGLWRAGGTWALPGSNDYAIGVDSNSMWFNANATNGYKFWNTSGNNNLMTLNSNPNGLNVPVNSYLASANPAGGNVQINYFGPPATVTDIDHGGGTTYLNYLGGTADIMHSNGTTNINTGGGTVDINRAAGATTNLNYNGGGTVDINHSIGTTNINTSGGTTNINAGGGTTNINAGGGTSSINAGGGIAYVNSGGLGTADISHAGGTTYLNWGGGTASLNDQGLGTTQINYSGGNVDIGHSNATVRLNEVGGTLHVNNMGGGNVYFSLASYINNEWHWARNFSLWDGSGANFRMTLGAMTFTGGSTFTTYLRISGGNGAGGNVPHNCVGKGASAAVTANGWSAITVCPGQAVMSAGCECWGPTPMVAAVPTAGFWGFPQTTYSCTCSSNATANVYAICCDY